jgi:putative hydrolase of HD superfamily
MPEKHAPDTKDDNAIQVLREELTALSPRSRKIATLYFQAHHLKHIYRKGWLENNISTKYCESIADHTFGVAFLVLILADEVDPSLNHEKLLKMALLHDYSESVIGDTTPRNEVDHTFRKHMESEIFSDFFSTLKGGQALIRLFHEFETQTSPEAKFLKEIDALEMTLQAVFYEKKHGVNPETFFQSAETSIHSPLILKLFQEIRSFKS